MENVKVKNAKKVEYDGVKFDSALEVFTYKQLKLLNVDFSYAGMVFEIIPALELKVVKAYWPNATGLDKKTLRQRIGQKAKTYTPDFSLVYKEHNVYFECKGFANDDAPTKKKLFLQYLENIRGCAIYFEPHNQKQVLECIEILKNLE